MANKKKTFIPMFFGPRAEEATAKSFAGMFSIENLNARLSEMDSFVTSRGWIDPVVSSGQRPKGRKKNGVSLLSPGGMAADREAYALYKAYLDYEALADLTIGMGEKQLAALGVAYSAGVSATEARAYFTMVKGRGAPKKSAAITEYLAAGAKAWKSGRRRPSVSKPTFKEIAACLPSWVAAGKRPSDKTLADWWTKFSRKILSGV